MNETRIIKLFAYLPKKIFGNFIWLKYYTREQEYRLVEKWRDMGYPDPGEKYLEMDWVNINYGKTKIGIEIVR